MVVTAACHCYLWWRLWSLTLCEQLWLACHLQLVVMEISLQPGIWMDWIGVNVWTSYYPPESSTCEQRCRPQSWFPKVDFLLHVESPRSSLLFHDKDISLGQLHEVACVDPMGDEFGYNKIFHVHLEHLIGIRLCECVIVKSRPGEFSFSIVGIRKRLRQKVTPAIQTASKQNHTLYDLHQHWHCWNSWLLLWSDFGQRRARTDNVARCFITSSWKGYSCVSCSFGEDTGNVCASPCRVREAIAPCKLGWCI
jgi:hypothetical protein